MIHISLRVGEITTESYIEIPRVSHLCFIAKSLYEFLSINAMSVYNKYIDIFFNLVKSSYEIIFTPSQAINAQNKLICS